MRTRENRQLVTGIFEELAKGNGEPFVEAWADDLSWTVMGTTEWSRTYRGKDTVIRELVQPLFAQFTGTLTTTARQIIAEDDYVVIQASGQATTKAGEAYNNRYCFIFRVEGGQIREITEYLDTALVESVLGSRVPAAAAE